MSANTQSSTGAKLANHWGEIKQMIALGVPKTKIAAKFGCSRETLRLRLKEEKAASPTGDGATLNPLEINRGGSQVNAFPDSTLSGHDNKGERA